MPESKQDYLAVLGLSGDASDDAIRAAYKKLVLQWHPDRHLVGKEHAAQMFIEVNKAYHALMDGKESTHSSTSSTTGSPASSANPIQKSTQPSSRPPSASSNSSKRSSSPPFSSSAPSDGHTEKSSKPSTRSKSSSAGSSSPHASSPDDLKHSSRTRPAKPEPKKNQSSSERKEAGRKSSKSHNHVRNPPSSTTSKTATSTSTHSHGSGGTNGSVHSKSKKTTGSFPSTAETNRESRPERASRSGSGRSRTSKPVIPPPSGCLHKSSKPGFADEFIHKLYKGAMKEPSDAWTCDQEAIPCGTPLRAINTPRGVAKEWIFPLPLTLDEMYHGTSYRFLVTRELLSHRTEEVEISIDIPPGMHSGTRIICPRTGHQRKDGTLQDVVFLVEEVPEERFSRVKDDLFLDVCIPWTDSLADQGGEICIQGIDGKEIAFALPYPIYDNATEGQVLVKGAGMPIRDGRKTVGRGDMIVRWRVVFTAHHSKWQTLKKALHLDV